MRVTAAAAAAALLSGFAESLPLGKNATGIKLGDFKLPDLDLGGKFDLDSLDFKMPDLDGIFDKDVKSTKGTCLAIQCPVPRVPVLNASDIRCPKGKASDECPVDTCCRWWVTPIPNPDLPGVTTGFFNIKTNTIGGWVTRFTSATPTIFAGSVTRSFEPSVIYNTTRDDVASQFDLTNDGKVIWHTDNPGLLSFLDDQLLLPAGDLVNGDPIDEIDDTRITQDGKFAQSRHSGRRRFR
uniref:P-type domain-containing protein n=1 Tax=Chromera velia CCMP2878 TaxID=1169474 RepID=A0A0G4H9U3_9ALVE|eukprot:Cvel_5980.t1-p1 / transcript=Cvel_5980.t1 / gene=Cvel_5980 / organism=Chromera_velia_CCMP2878 / gene_product=hypothetical protein / transcript_product=hypothetical protein / location=Cvel_scaffold286:73882-74595(-) / protein_length=238 / sequence_SO=supercontig / SO=protein_coding / is_pseudo=false